MKIITKNIPTKFVKLGKLEIKLKEFEQIMDDIDDSVYTNNENEITKELIKLKIIKYDKKYCVYFTGKNFIKYLDKFYDLEW